MAEVRMPKLSDSMETGAVAQWLVEDGTTVQAGADIVEIETDKAVMTHQAAVSGVLRIGAEVGVEVPVGEIIATIDET